MTVSFQTPPSHRMLFLNSFRIFPWQVYSYPPPSKTPLLITLNLFIILRRSFVGDTRGRCLAAVSARNLGCFLGGQ